MGPWLTVVKNDDRLEGSFDDQDASERPELIAPLRRLIHSVVVHAQPGVKGAFDVEIKGRLPELLKAPFLKRAVGGEALVAGEGAAATSILATKTNKFNSLIATGVRI